MVVFAGIDHGNGCSRIAASVAETLAGNARGAVCLVEANFRSPALPAMLGTTNHHGLTDALLQEGPIRSFIKPVCNDSLWLLSSGSLAADSPNLLSSERLKARSAELRKEFEFVIVDAPPLTRYADAIALGQLSDGIVLVLEAESTRREAALDGGRESSIFGDSDSRRGPQQAHIPDSGEDLQQALNRALLRGSHFWRAAQR